MRNRGKFRPRLTVLLIPQNIIQSFHEQARSRQTTAIHATKSRVDKAPLANPQDLITIRVISTELLCYISQLETLGVSTRLFNVKRTCKYLARGSGP